MRGFAWAGVIEIEQNVGVNRCRWKERKTMKTMLMTLGAVALSALTLNAVAGDALLSPRAATVQIKTVAGLNNDANQINTSGMAVMPRALDRTVKATGAGTEVNPVMACHNMAASPKLIGECAMTMTPGMPCCKEVASTKP